MKIPMNYYRMALLGCVLFTMLAKQEVRSAEKIPPEAVAAAQGYLDFTISGAKERPDWFWRKWKIQVEGDFSSIRFGNPYRTYFLGETEVMGFADHQNLVDESNFEGYGFPVFDGARFIGTILVSRDDDKWQYAGRHFVYDHMDTRILELQKHYSSNGRYSLGYIRSYKLGVYIVVLDGDIPIKIAPTAKWAADVISVEASADMQYPMVDYNIVKPKLLKRAREVRDAVDIKESEQND